MTSAATKHFIADLVCSVSPGSLFLLRKLSSADSLLPTLIDVCGTSGKKKKKKR